MAAPHYFVSSRNQVISSPAIDFQVGTCHLRNLVAMFCCIRGASPRFHQHRIPRYLYIEGRQVEVSQGIKKWYSIQLDAEESHFFAEWNIVNWAGKNEVIAAKYYLLIRFSHSLCQPYDLYQNAFVDAVEVYARDTVAKWSQESEVSRVSRSSVNARFSSVDTQESPSR
jgi:hypothetical protein